ncbi:transglycosylase domain-containing protein [Kiloniella sp. b19]|uniref:transglycosylase domain-containing protein n=1 Tax=Kiloniella sp. GXU_MW_B19 TaxID=3141326 RepID=UPI0031D0C310
MARRPTSSSSRRRTATRGTKSKSEGTTRSKVRRPAAGDIKGEKRKRAASGSSAGSRKKASGKSGKSWVRRLFGWAFVLGIWGSIAVALVIGYYALDLPSVGTLEQASRRPSVTFEAADGTRLASYGDYYGDTLEVGEVSRYLPQAIIAIEDRRFYDHFGVDPLGIARAMWINMRTGRFTQGGSTLTQQLAKNLFLSPERSIKRKIQEALLSLWLEQNFTKDEILSIYMNRVYLGAGTYGFDAASRVYFGKSARDLKLSEAAVLAGLLKAPSRYNPSSSPKLARERSQLVLGAMAEEGFITQDQLQKARENPVSFRKGKQEQAPYFTDWVRGQIDGLIGEYEGDLTIRTTLDRRAQRIAEQHLQEQLSATGKKNGVEQGAVTVLAPDGAVQALVGGRDYGASQYNRASQALRQPGSAFKPFVFLAGFERGLNPDTVMNDQPISVDGWKPGNYKNKYYGEVTLREAFARSSNSVAVQVSQRVSPERVADVAQRLGIDATLDPSPALALGSSETTLLDLTGAYAIFANGGLWSQPYGIQSIRDRQGRVLYSRQTQQGARVVTEGHVAMMNNIMVAAVDWGTGKAAKIDRPVAGKTGTTQSNRDALFVGYTPKHVVGVWYGNDNGSPMKGVTGGTLPARSWGKIVRDLEYGTPALALNTQVPSSLDTALEQVQKDAGDFSTAIGRLLGGIFGGGSDSRKDGEKSESRWKPNNTPIWERNNKD